MNNKNYVICGCVRNCEKYLDKVFENIKKIQNEVNILEIIIAYDNSNDKSLFKLCQLKKKFNIKILLNKNELTNHRTLNISNARNKILNYIYNSNLPIDYFIMMDFDDVTSKPININVFKEGLELEWDCITYNNKNYYDYWALSIDNFIYSCWHWNNPREMIKKMYLYLKKKIENSSTYLECDSAFNGFGIYKKTKFIDCSYNPFINFEILDKEKINNCSKKTKLKPLLIKNRLDCEHRNFHLLSKKKYNSKIIIYKKNLFPPYEGEHCNFLRN